MKLLVIDSETTGVDPSKHQAIEWAGALWSTDHGSLIGAFSFIVKADSNAAEHVNHIPAAMLNEHGVERTDAAGRVAVWMHRCDVVLAHSAAFDASFLPPEVSGLRPWVCTCDDVEWPGPQGTSKSLVALCLERGVGVASAHRALTDVILLVRLLERVREGGCNIEAMIRHAMRPKMRYAAVTVRFDAALNERLKAAGFRWSPDRREWWRRCFVDDVERVRSLVDCELRESPL